MGLVYQPILFSGFTLGSSGGSSSPTIGNPVIGADNNSVLIVDSSGNLADVPLSNGQIVIGGTGSEPIAATITGTSNQVIVTNGPGSITLSLPQNIATTSSPTFANLSLTPSASIDLTSTGTLAIGTSNANIINIGNSGATINIQGNTFYQNVTDLNVADKNITINHGGSAGSASNAGLQVEEGGSITGYTETSSDRNSWEFLAPNTAGIVTITPGASGFTINQGSHNPVTLGTASGLSLSTQVLSLAVSSASQTGALSSTDWSTFNNKQNALVIGDISDAGTDGIVVTGGTGAIIGSGVTLAQHVSDASHNGYLSSTDWSTFSAKQTSGNYITDLTGDITASGPGSVAATLATVNANVGSFGSTSSVPAFTVNAKGLVTAVTGTSIQIAESQVTNLVTDLAAKQNIVSGDIAPASFSGLANNTASQTITGLAFATTVSSFEAFLNIQIIATANTYTTVKILGTRKATSDWSVADIEPEFTGSAIPGLAFGITSVGQVQISVGSTTGFASGTIKFRAMALS